jgi:hypothetical protein
MDAAAHHGAALLCRRQCRRHQGPDRRENEGCVEHLGRHLVRTAGPHGTEAAGEILRRRVARSGEGENPAALVARHLRQDVRRRAETVDAERFAVARQPQCAVADQASAEQRRRLDIAEGLRDREAIALIGDGQLCIAAVDLIAGEAGAVA